MFHFSLVYVSSIPAFAAFARPRVRRYLGFEHLYVRFGRRPFDARVPPLTYRSPASLRFAPRRTANDLRILGRRVLHPAARPYLYCTRFIRYAPRAQRGNDRVNSVNVRR